MEFLSPNSKLIPPPVPVSLSITTQAFILVFSHYLHPINPYTQLTFPSYYFLNLAVPLFPYDHYSRLGFHPSHGETA